MAAGLLSSSYSALDWFFVHHPRRRRRHRVFSPVFDYRLALHRARHAEPAPDHGWTYLPEDPGTRTFYRTKTRPSMGAR